MKLIVSTVLATVSLATMADACNYGAAAGTTAGAVVGAEVLGPGGAIAGAVIGEGLHQTCHDLFESDHGTVLQESYPSWDTLENDLTRSGIRGFSGGGSSSLDSQLMSPTLEMQQERE